MVSQPRHGTPEEGKARILRAARERYLRGKRIELTQLAAEEGVGRATAYRWLGDNDRLIAEILAERVRKNFVRLLRENNGLTGRERVLSVVEGSCGTPPGRVISRHCFGATNAVSSRSL